ncbi:MAG: TMEM165/GDT1 family protein [Candidatus Heimdallarchaeota archaeon]
MASFFVDLVSTGGVIMAAEFADKTNLLALSLMGKSKQPYTVAFGGILGIAFVTIIGVVVGSIISTFILIDYVPIFAGLLFLWIGLVELRSDSKEDAKTKDLNRNYELDSKFKIIKSSFMLIGLAEFGDKSQIFVIGRSLDGDPVAIFLGAIIGMGIIMFATAIFGDKLITKFPEDLIHKIANYGFVVVGFLLIVLGLIKVS